MRNVSLTDVPQPDESTLIRYLVGRASEDEAEQLDERSIVDEGFAQRLRAVEHDLVDAYTNGELTGDTLEGFRLQYLRSPAGLAQVEFARALSGAAVTGQASPPRVAPEFRALPRWQLAAAVLVLAASGYLVVDNLLLRRQVSAVRQARAELEQRVRQLQEEVGRQQSATSATEEELARAREALAAARAPANQERPGGQSILALVLRAATREAGEIPQLVVRKGVDAVVLQLPLVAVDFPNYEAELRDATGDRVIWRSGRLGAPAARNRPMIPVTVPASLLASRTYILELTGISARGVAEPLDTYPFRVVP
jgi:hypothetical protein